MEDDSKIVPISLITDKEINKLKNTPQVKEEKAGEAKKQKLKPKIISQETLSHNVKIKVRKTGKSASVSSGGKENEQRRTPAEEVRRPEKVLDEIFDPGSTSNYVKEKERKPRRILEEMFYPRNRKDPQSGKSIQEKEFRRENALSILLKDRERKKAGKSVERKEHTLDKQLFEKQINIKLKRLSEKEITI